MVVSGTITVTALTSGGENNNIQVLLNNCAPFPDYISKINNTQIDNAEDIDVVMTMNNLIKYSDNYSETSTSLRQYYRDEPSLNDNDVINNFPGNSASFKFK